MPESKLTEDDLKDIVLAFSEARMKPYLNATNNNYSDAIRIYEINTKLCEALYPSLHTLEISLRNQMNTVLSVKYDNDWFTIREYDRFGEIYEITSNQFDFIKVYPNKKFS